MPHSLKIICLILALVSCKNIAEKKSIKDQTLLEIKEDNRKYFLTRCSAFASGDTTTLEFSDTTPGNQGLKIVKIKNAYDVQYEKPDPVTDSSYRPPVYKLISKDITIKNDKNESVEGVIDVKILATYLWETLFIDTIRISGKFKTSLKL